MRIQTLLNHSSKDDFGSSYAVHRDARNSTGSHDYAQQRPSLQLHGSQLSDSVYRHRSSSPRSSGESWLEGSVKNGPSFHEMGSGYILASSTSQQSAKYHRERTSFSSRSSQSGSFSLSSSTATTAPFRDAPVYNEYDHEQTAQPRHLLLHAESSKPQQPGFHPPTLLPPLSIYPSNSMDYSPSSTVVDGRSTSFSMASSTYHGSAAYPHAISPYPAYYARLPASKSSYDASNSGSNPLMRFADAVMEDANRERRLDLGGRHTWQIPSPKSGDHRLNIDPLLQSDNHHSGGETGPDTPLFLPASSPTPPPTPASCSSPTLDSVSCSYCTVCTTNSPLRKVVSHIFGRNKLSTRQIPSHVWVYYCRKHYQRSRYRNPQGFARQQVALVRRQCQRLEEWGGVKDWTIKVRRREEMRMNRLKSSPEDSNDYHQGDNQPGATAPWIEDFLGRQKSIHVVYHLLEKIDDEVQRNGGKFPDVELLPNVDLSLMKDETDQMREGEAREKKRIRVGEHRSPGKRVKSTNESPSSPAMMRRSSRFPATPPM